MKKLMWSFLLLFFAGILNSFAQAYQMTDGAAAIRIQKDICILASDSLLGREAGTLGEWMSRKYIEAKYKEIGLKPLFDTSYFESFTFSDVDFFGAGTATEVNGKKLQLYKDYYPIGFSSNDTVSGEMIFAGTGIYCEEAGINDYLNLSLAGKIAVIDLAVPDKIM
ncbi:MAG TPA: hypothetical protein PLQ44_03295, partial [Candidatus Paceibacterota bacterium]|nr:hypothetical protein [Candidatus Paceibacterota bacterium]